MNSKLLKLDTLFCSAWALMVLGKHLNWMYLNSVLLLSVVLIRLAIPFLLSAKEKRAWIPIVVNMLLCILLVSCSGHSFFSEMGRFAFHVSGLDLDDNMVQCISVVAWLWLMLLPLAYYAYLKYKHRLVVGNYTIGELCGSILWHDRKAKYTCAVLGVALMALLVGVYMQHRLCQTACFMASPFVYGLVCRYYGVKMEKLWVVLLAMVCFWYAQVLGGIYRALLLLISFMLVVSICIPLLRRSCSYAMFMTILLLIGVFIPSFSVGYNQYACINYPRKGYYYLAPYSGILIIKDSFNGNHIGLRDRYGLLLKPEYEKIIPYEYNGLGHPLNYRLLKNETVSYCYDLEQNKVSAITEN